MDITIIGTGNMARGIATRALEGGNARHAARARAGEGGGARARSSPAMSRAGQVGDPLDGDVVVLAVWYQAVPDVLARYGDQFDGKVVVDITNPVDPDTYAPLTVEAGSVAQEIAEHRSRARRSSRRSTPRSRARWSRARSPGRRWTCSSPATTTRPSGVVAQLATDGGLRAIDVGPLALAHQLEGAGYLNMAVQPALGTNYGSALKVVA